MMTKRFNKKIIKENELRKALRKIGLTRGDTVLVHSSLRNMGKIEGIDEKDRHGYCQAIFQCFDRVLGLTNHSGTLIVPAFTHGYVKKQQPFYLEKTPAETGIFCEYVRQQPGSLRTLHPIASLCVIGRHKEAFKNLSTSAYGINSAFDVLTQIPRAKVVYLGAIFNHTTLMHHLEQLVGVSYMYHKAYFKPPVFVGRRRLSRPFYSFVRYLNRGVVTNYNPVGTELAKRGLVQEVLLNDFRIMCAGVSDIMRVGYEMFQQNQCVFLEREYYFTR